LNQIAAAEIECGAQYQHSPTSRQRQHSSRESWKSHVKEVLEQQLGRTVPTIAFPYGHHDKTVQQLVREADYTSACAVKNALNHVGADVFGRARIKISNGTNEPRLARLLNGKGIVVASQRESLLTLPSMAKMSPPAAALQLADGISRKRKDENPN
jgi:hypothetical protein